MNADASDAAQPGFTYRFDWGPEGLAVLAPHCDVIVIVDVLRFTTAVSAAVEAGATVYPFVGDAERALAHAAEHRAVLVGPRDGDPPSLSPTDLLRLTAGDRIVLPSANGASLACSAGESGVPFVLAGCLRNATATARRAIALAHDGAIGVIAAGERWDTEDAPLRPALEDLLGAGSILHALDPAGAVRPPWSSPEARAARAAFLDARPLIDDALVGTPSGRELVGRGFADDVAIAAEVDATDLAAQLVDGAFVGG